VFQIIEINDSSDQPTEVLKGVEKDWHEVPGSLTLIYIFFSMSLPAHSGPRPLIQFHNHFYTFGRTPWTSGQLVARSLTKQDNTNTE
jgi:hypothetical protein